MAQAVTRGNILLHHSSHPLVLDLLLTKEFGTAWWEWEPETLDIVLPGHFGTPSVSHTVLHKLEAIRATHTAPQLVFGEWECFLPVVTALNNVIPDFDVMQVPPLARVYAGLRMLRMLEPDAEFSEEVRRYVACVVLYRGVYYGPGELAFVQDLLRRPYYVCPDCGNHEDVLEDHDGVCDACGRDWFAQLSGKAIKRPGVTMYVRHDERPVRARFKEAAVDWSKFRPDDDSVEDVQVCKVAAALAYSLQRDREFLEQKKALQL